MGEHRFLSGNVIAMPQGASMPEYHLPWCFGCGPENEHGLGLRFRIDGDRVTAQLDFAPWFQGGPGVVHGGATAAFFDDLMGSVMMAHLRPAVTAKLEVNYLRPIPLGVTIKGEAWLAASEGRKLWVEAVGVDLSGEVRYIEARALFIPVGVEHWVRATEGVDEGRLEAAMRYREGEYYP